ncbi:hypothetical protein [Amycolatopsis sp. RTGN1]|uniref:hypothetical protein n=1 Tax=Amycolatopsis ponsaeliensis TaxID=2992142 RepID=UPI002551882A|nr:hypothetical protein [Amycolatopsis sp. RTGN1]
MRRSIGSRSIATRAVKALLAMGVLLVAVGVASPAVASAAPANTGAVVTAAAPMTGSWNVAPRATDGQQTTTAAVFTCNWFSRTPFQIVDFTCQVTSGAMRVYIICSNGQRINSAALPAVGTYNVRLTCPGVRVQTIGWESLT